MRHQLPTSGRRRARHWLWVATVVALLALAGCSDDSDDSDDDSGTSNGEAGNEQDNGSTDGGDGDRLEASNLDRTLRLTVDSVAREDDLVVIEGAITNTGQERFIPVGKFAELDFDGTERAESNDLSGFVVIDWENRTAHYPARTDAGDCACTIIGDRYEGTLDPGDSMDYFVAYELDDPSSELTLVAPRFQPVDGLPVERD